VATEECLTDHEVDYESAWNYSNVEELDVAVQDNSVINSDDYDHGIGGDTIGLGLLRNNNNFAGLQVSD